MKNSSVDFPAKRNIVLTGFMGTGKTTVGLLLAERLDRPFIDIDSQIEVHFGKPISEVFADEGEAVFRVAEAQICAQLGQEEGLIISTGGGALVNPGNRTALSASGTLICLTATVDEILLRLERMVDRPLLPEDPAEKRRRIHDLLYERRQAYAAIPQQIDTTGRDPAAIVDHVLEALSADTEVSGMIRIPVTSPSNRYDICIGEGLMGNAGQLLLNRGLIPGGAAIVTNPVVGEIYAERLAQSLLDAGFDPTVCSVPEGEEYKTLESIRSLYDQFLIAGLDRRSPVISLGGGVIGDMAGFAAASYLRGVPFVQIPTSLLSMVDASVGGKTGVDMPQGKNLVGAFKQPQVVIIDTAVMETLPSREFQAGLAEIVKHGIIGAPDLFEQLEAHGPTSLNHLVADAVRVKVDVVQEDPFEQGRRATLNLGHTFGHAIELVSEFAVGHGEGVALGLVASAHMAASLGRCTARLATRIEALVDRMGLPTSVSGYDVDAVMAAMLHDKKRSGKLLRFVIPQDLGDVVVIDNPGDAYVREALERILTK